MASFMGDDSEDEWYVDGYKVKHGSDLDDEFADARQMEERWASRAGVRRAVFSFRHHTAMMPAGQDRSARTPSVSWRDMSARTPSVDAGTPTASEDSLRPLRTPSLDVSPQTQQRNFLARSEEAAAESRANPNSGNPPRSGGDETSKPEKDASQTAHFSGEGQRERKRWGGSNRPY